MKNIFLLGLGAVGASIAAQFYDANYPIKVICDSKRKARYRRDGFIINNRDYKFNYVTNKEYKNEQPADLVLIAVKYYNLEDAILQLDGLIGEKTIIASLLNGIDSEDIITDYCKCDKNIIPAFIYKIDAIKAKNVINCYSQGIIVCGEKKVGLLKK